MTSALSPRAMPKAAWIALALNSLFLGVNGLVMLLAPRLWYASIPGVTDTGFFNQHFVRDIGIVQLLLGLAFVAGAMRPAVRFEWWMAATVWLVAHALFHVWEVMVGICGASALLRDFPAVSLPALLGIGLTVCAGRRRAL